MARRPEDPPHGGGDAPRERASDDGPASDGGLTSGGDSSPADQRPELPPQPPGAPGVPQWPGAPQPSGAAEEAANGAGGRRPPRTPLPIRGNRYGRWIGVLGVIFLIVVTINTFLTTPNGAAGLHPGEKVPAFAVPLVQSSLNGAANTNRKKNEGGNHKPAACEVRGADVLNICELYERGPVVLALFTDKGSCPQVLTTMQALAPSFPGVSFAAVAIKNERPELKQLMKQRQLTLPVGYDEEGELASPYRLATCPQVSFIERGGRVQSKALLVAPTRARLRALVTKLIAASSTGAAKPPGGGSKR